MLEERTLWQGKETLASSQWCCCPACPAHHSWLLSLQTWVPHCGQGTAPCGTVWGAAHGPVCCSPGPTLRMKQNSAEANKCCFWLHQQGSWGSSRGDWCAGMSDRAAGSGRARGAPLPGLLHTTWHSPISIISRQPHAPFAAHGATRQAASRGSILAGF